MICLMGRASAKPIKPLLMLGFVPQPMLVQFNHVHPLRTTRNKFGYRSASRKARAGQTPLLGIMKTYAEDRC
jgi:hypothetical protein